MKPEHKAFRERFRSFISTEILPHYEKWERDGKVARSCYIKAAKGGFYCSMGVPTEYGGGGKYDDFMYNAIVAEELEDMGAGGIFFTLGNDMVLSYFVKCCNAEQKKKWLPGIAEGKVLCVAMSEPQAGSDLAGISAEAVKSTCGKHWILNGRKMWISNAAICDMIVVACFTDKKAGYKGISLLVVEKDMEGFEVLKRFAKLGKHPQDTCLIGLSNVKVPVENVIGNIGEGFIYLMRNLPKERLSVAVTAMAGARRALKLSIDYVQGRSAFGGELARLQTVQFAIAEMRTEIQVATSFVDNCILGLCNNTLSTEVASMAKLHATELSFKVADRCLQLFGGYGYLKNSPIGKLWVDHRVLRIYAGSNEVMKEIVAKGCGFKPQRFTPVPSTVARPAKQFSLEEVSKHNKEGDLWVVVNGDVLDLTAFLYEHPGGKMPIMNWAGKDATVEFNSLHGPDLVDKYIPASIIGTVKAPAAKL